MRGREEEPLAALRRALVTLERELRLGDVGPSDTPSHRNVFSTPSREPETVFWGGGGCWHLCVSSLGSVVGSAAQQSLRIANATQSSSL